MQGFSPHRNKKGFLNEEPLRLVIAFEPIGRYSEPRADLESAKHLGWLLAQ